MSARAGDPRIEKALTLADRVKHRDDIYEVPGNDRPFYLVVYGPGEKFCGCKDFEIHHHSCKHIVAVSQHLTHEKFKDNPLRGLPTG